MRRSTRTKYEEEFSNLVHVKGARAFCLGRYGLVILLKALGIQTGDRIGICSFTCLSVPEAVKVCGAKPVYLDVDEYLCIDPQEILRQQVGSLKVVILQHTFGVPGRLDELLSACARIGAKVIEDCAHSLGCFWKGTSLGSFGEGAVYSFQFGKPYTTGQGGLLTVNSTALLDKVDEQIVKLASPMPVKYDLALECKRRLFYAVMGTRYENFVTSFSAKRHDKTSAKERSKIEYDFRLHSGYIRLAGARMSVAGLQQVRKWHKLKELRRRNTEKIKQRFCEARLDLWPIPPEADITMLRYPLLTPDKSGTIQLARKTRVDLASWYASPVHPLRNADLPKVDYQIGSCQRAEQMISRLVHIPTGTALRNDVLQTLIDILKAGYYEKKCS